MSEYEEDLLAHEVSQLTRKIMDIHDKVAMGQVRHHSTFQALLRDAIGIKPYTECSMCGRNYYYLIGENLCEDCTTRVD